jgi:hypothetical protein
LCATTILARPSPGVHERDKEFAEMFVAERPVAWVLGVTAVDALVKAKDDVR